MDASVLQATERCIDHCMPGVRGELARRILGGQRESERSECGEGEPGRREYGRVGATEIRADKRECARRERERSECGALIGKESTPDDELDAPGSAALSALCEARAPDLPDEPCVAGEPCVPGVPAEPGAPGEPGDPGVADVPGAPGVRVRGGVVGGGVASCRPAVTEGVIRELPHLTSPPQFEFSTFSNYSSVGCDQVFRISNRCAKMGAWHRIRRVRTQSPRGPHTAPLAARSAARSRGKCRRRRRCRRARVPGVRCPSRCVLSSSRSVRSMSPQ